MYFEASAHDPLNWAGAEAKQCNALDSIFARRPSSKQRCDVLYESKMKGDIGLRMLRFYDIASLSSQNAKYVENSLAKRVTHARIMPIHWRDQLDGGRVSR